MEGFNFREMTRNIFIEFGEKLTGQKISDESLINECVDMVIGNPNSKEKDFILEDRQRIIMEKFRMQTTHRNIKVIDFLKPINNEDFYIDDYNSRVDDIYFITFNDFIFNIEELREKASFYAIKKNYREIELYIDDFMYLSNKQDYKKRIEKVIKNSMVDKKDTLYYKIERILLNPNIDNDMFKNLLIKAFKQDSDYWEEVLSNYKIKRFYIKRLEYLINVMDELLLMNISCLNDKIIEQKKQYIKELDASTKVK